MDTKNPNITETTTKKITNITSQWWVTGVLVILIIAMGFWYISAYSVNVPYWDQFDYDVPLIIHLAEGRITPGDILQTHTDSRPILPTLFVLLNGVVSKGNMQSEIFLSYLLYILSFCVLGFLAIRTVPSHPYAPLILVPVAAYYFNFFMLGNLLWGGMSIFFSSFVLFLALTIFFLERTQKVDKWYMVAVLSATCCMFSFSPGLIIWVTGLVYFLILKREQQIQKIMGWIMAAVVTLYIHLVYLGVSSDGVHGTSGYRQYILTFIHYPFQKFICFLGAVGSDIIHVPITSVFYGAIILITITALLIYNRKDLHPKKTGIWYVLLLYSLLTTFMLTLSRSGDGGMFGPETNLIFLPDIRHFINTILIVVALFILASWYFFDMLTSKPRQTKKKSQQSKNTHVMNRRITSILMAISLMLLILGTFFHTNAGITHGEGWKFKQEENREIFINSENESQEALKNLHPLPDTVLDCFKAIRANNLRIFSS